jgi:hypothetical protein
MSKSSMENSVVQQVEKWYGHHSAALSRISTQLSIRSLDAADAVEGKVEIRVETPRLLASVTFWNYGPSVSVLAVDKRLRRDLTLDDRKLDPSDDVSSLLDGYFRKITDPDFN